MGANPLEFIEIESEEDLLLAQNLIDSVLHDYFSADKLGQYAQINSATDKIWGVRVNGSIIAAAVLRNLQSKPTIRELRSMVVAKSWQRGGIGAFMLQKLGEYAKASEVTHFLVKLDRCLDKGCPFFEKNSFVQTGQENDSGEFIVVLAI